MNTGKTIATDTLKNNVMTTKELAKALGVDISTVIKTVNRLKSTSEILPKFKQGQTPRYTEEQATLIKQEIQKHHNLASRQIDKTTSEYEMELLTQKVLAYHIQKANEYKSRAEIAEHQLIEQQPKVEFYDDVTGSKDTIDMKEVAKILNIKNIGRNKLFEILRNKNILDRFNQPYQKYVDAGYFRVIESRFNLPDGEIKISLKTVVFQKGLDFIRRELAKKSA